MKATKNICMIVLSHYEGDPRVKREAKSLIKNGYNLYCISLRKKGEPKERDVDGVKVIKIMKWLQKFPQGSIFRYLFGFTFFIIDSFFTLLKLNLCGVKFDVLHFHNPPDHLVFIGIFHRLFKRSKIILDRHESFALQVLGNLNIQRQGFLYNLLKFYEKINCMIANAVILVNRMELEDLEAMLPNKSIFLVRNSLDIENIKIHEDIETKEDNYFTVLYQGYIAKKRDLNTVVEAIKIADESIPKLRCLILGDGEYLENLKILVKEKGIEDLIEIRGWVDSSIVIKEIKKADVCLITLTDTPAYRRATPNKLFEYMYFKKPIIAANFEYLKELSEDTCLYYQPSNSSDLAKKIIETYKFPDFLANKLERMSEVLKHNLWELDEKNLLECYKFLIK
ncbi:MAG: glycosyltransferase [Candidatus Heimdallarchaeaceae archaeon]